MNDTDIGDWTLFVLTAIVVNFTVWYAVKSRWWINMVGKGFLSAQIGISIVLLQIDVSVLTDSQYPFRDVIRTGIYGTGCVAYLLMTWFLWREQRRDRRRKKECANHVR